MVTDKIRDLTRPSKAIVFAEFIGQEVGEAAAPPTIDAALRAAYDNAAIYYPFTDLILSDPYSALTDGTVLAFSIGPSEEVGGTKTIMVAWANDDVFLQIWIGADDKLPRRVRAIWRNDPLQLPLGSGQSMGRKYIP